MPLHRNHGITVAIIFTLLLRVLTSLMVIGVVVVIVGRGRGARVSAPAPEALVAVVRGIARGHGGLVQVVQHLLAECGGREPLPLRRGGLQFPL